MSVGPPQLLLGNASPFSEGASASADGRVIAVPQGDSTLLLNRDIPGQRVVLGPQYDVRFSAVSPDGAWVVTCSHWSDGRSTTVRIWDAHKGQPVSELPLHGSTSAFHSGWHATDRRLFGHHRHLRLGPAADPAAIEGTGSGLGVG
jgi:hypothetical protein